MTNTYALIENLSHANREIAFQAKNELLKQGSSIVPLLISALASHDQSLLMEVARMLGLFKKEARTAVKALITICYINNPKLRANVISSLGLIAENAELCVPVLKRYLKDDSVEVRRHTVEALGQFREASRSVTYELAIALQDRDAVVRELAAGILYELGSVPFHVLPNLFKARQDSNPYVKLSITQLLGKISRDNGMSVTDLGEICHQVKSYPEKNSRVPPFPLQLVTS